jgi:hypothetical protein
MSERAAARGIPAATYVSVLTRALLRSLSPLPKQELLALRRTVAELRTRQSLENPATEAAIRDRQERVEPGQRA